MVLIVFHSFSCYDEGKEKRSGKEREKRMTLTQLRYFCTAARYHSITQAARILFVTQPAVSIAIRDLEKEFSLTLFHHAGGQISLTEEGEIFYRKAELILGTCDDLKNEYSGKTAPSHAVRIGIPPLLSTVFFPEMLDSFHVEHPDTWLELQEFGSVRACSLVQDEILDIGLVNMELPNIDKFNTLELRKDSLCYCVCPNHPLASSGSLDLKQLHLQPVILLNRDSVQNQLLMTQFEALKIHPRIIMHSSQITTILRFLEQGKCGCFFYESMLSRFPELIGLPLSLGVVSRIGLVWKKGKYINSGMKEFLGFCKNLSS